MPPGKRVFGAEREADARPTLFYSVTMPGDVEPQAREAAAGNDHVAVQLVPRDNGGAFINALHRAKRNPKLRIDNVRRSKNLAMVMNRCKKQWAGLLDDLPMLFYLHPSGERLEDTTTIESLCRLNNVSSEPDARLTLFYTVTMAGDSEPQAQAAAADVAAAQAAAADVAAAQAAAAGGAQQAAAAAADVAVADKEDEEEATDEAEEAASAAAAAADSAKHQMSMARQRRRELGAVADTHSQHTTMADVHAYLLSTSATGSTGASTAEAAAAEAAAAEAAAAGAAAAEAAAAGAAAAGAAAAEAAEGSSSTVDAVGAASYYPGQAEKDASYTTLILAALAERSPRTLDELLAYTKAGRTECAPCVSFAISRVACMLMRRL